MENEVTPAGSNVSCCQRFYKNKFLMAAAAFAVVLFVFMIGVCVGAHSGSYRGDYGRENFGHYGKMRRGGFGGWEHGMRGGYPSQVMPMQDGFDQAMPLQTAPSPAILPVAPSAGQ